LRDGASITKKRVAEDLQRNDAKEIIFDYFNVAGYEYSFGVSLSLFIKSWIL
jgi:hypothetical protein